MDYQRVMAAGGDTQIHGVQNFDVDDILDCGQCFRWEKLGNKRYSGIAMGRRLVVEQAGDMLILRDTTPSEFRDTWHSYFDFERDYTEIKERLSRDEAMGRAIAFCPGMRVVRQEPWEALCSFIISQNNNIPRIKGIVERLCQEFGEAITDGGYAFPSPQQLAGRSLEELAVVRSGFRAKYILDAARSVAEGEIDLQTLFTGNLEEARAQLRRIQGVGPKVAECALLYGLGRGECFPVDVWIARAMEQLYPSGFPAELEDIAGLGQQYLFHYMRKGREKESREPACSGA